MSNWKSLLMGLLQALGRRFRTERGESITEAALTIGLVLLLAGAVVVFVDWSRLRDGLSNAFNRAVSAPFSGEQSTHSQ